VSFRGSCECCWSGSESAFLQRWASPHPRGAVVTQVLAEWMDSPDTLLLKLQSCWKWEVCVCGGRGGELQSRRWWPPPLLYGGKGSTEHMLGWLIGMAGVACVCQGSRDYWAEQTAGEIFLQGAEQRICFHWWKLSPKKELSLLAQLLSDLTPCSTWPNSSQYAAQTLNKTKLVSHTFRVP